MTNNKSPYTYRFMPHGENEQQKQEIVDWLQHQNNKSLSISMLILQSIQTYGKDDLVHLITQEFLNGKKNHRVQENAEAVETQSQSGPMPEPTPTAEQTPEPTKSTENPNSNGDSNPGINLGLLSH